MNTNGRSVREMTAAPGERELTMRQDGMLTVLP